MSKEQQNEKPEVYALHQDGGNWQISRRDFLKAAGIGAAALSIGLNSRFVRPAFAAQDMSELCKTALAHEKEITSLALSTDGKYLLSYSYDDNKMKVWDMENYALLAQRAIKNADHFAAGTINGIPVVICNNSGSKQLRISTLPEMREVDDLTISTDWLGSEPIVSICPSRSGDIYICTESHIGLIKQGIGKYADHETLHQDTIDKFGYAITGGSLFDNDRKMFLTTKDSKCRIIDLESGEEKPWELPGITRGDGFAFTPGEASVFYAIAPEWRIICLVSLLDGSTIWKHDLAGTESPNQTVYNTAVTPDGSYGIIYGQASKQVIGLVSMADGSFIREIETGGQSSDCTHIVVSRDGTKFAVANKQSILFISLPDLQVIGCPLDLNVMRADEEGIEITGTDPVSGKTVTYTLPCGSPIPAGAVCTCNCVSGYVPLPTAVPTVKPTAKPGCGCNSHTYTYTYSSHYWHPN